jgi:uncharacterized protein (TIGR00299 family) protein
MKTAYLDCFAGISGDMFLGALIGAGVDPKILEEATAAMNLGASLKVETVDRSGISSTKVHVFDGTHLAELAASEDHFHEQHTHEVEGLHRHPEVQHEHKTGHPDANTETHHHNGEQAHTHEILFHNHKHDPSHSHSHDHSHGRSLTVIRELIRSSALPEPVVRTAIRAFELLGESEAKIHNVPVGQIHFHEVGAVDAIIDIVAASAGIHALAAERWVASPLNVGGGMVDCAHGRFPVPAPATADLLRGLPTYSASVQMELVTPTGAALLRALVEEKGLTFGPQPAMAVENIGYGAGTRNPANFPNVLRLSVGEATDVRVPEPSRLHRDGWDEQHSNGHHHRSQTVTVLETALDDTSPQLLAHVAETALKMGALDVMLTPVIMKKGRPGTMLTILCDPAESEALQQLLLRETTTLGIRIREDRRACLDRSFITVETRYGPVKMKLGSLNGETLNANPEFEDCRAAAASHGVAVKTVQQSAIAAYLTQTTTAPVTNG